MQSSLDIRYVMLRIEIGRIRIFSRLAAMLSWLTHEVETMGNGEST